MSTASPTLLESFHAFVGKQMASPSNVGMSPDEALARWHEQEETIAVIREGLADVQAGRVQALEEFLQELRSESKPDGP